MEVVKSPVVGSLHEPLRLSAESSQDSDRFHKSPVVGPHLPTCPALPPQQAAHRRQDSKDTRTKNMRPRIIAGSRTANASKAYSRRAYQRNQELLIGVRNARRWNPHQQTNPRENVEQPLPPRYHAPRPPCAPLPSRFAHGALRPVGHHAGAGALSRPLTVAMSRATPA